ncbi:hypothetical protein [Caenispirillum bisanense]|uniref:hypothetical protein n=1 Tax=Caenispirillum bisanense TaxID=414052 RepID=UPI001596898F|nr:hypothetical protein [Caenispirillum bisanense]
MMVIKGSSRGMTRRDAGRLARHLLAAENESVDVLGLHGVVSKDIAGAFEEMRAIARGTRCRKAIYHASINVDPEEAERFGAERWTLAADVLGQRLGLECRATSSVRSARHRR